uniref:Uncharacterized protein n=1 Tax=Rhizophora mucronata TaxID=61149 RepID=A0A2P2JX10_RHIMU
MGRIEITECLLLPLKVVLPSFFVFFIIHLE